MKRIPRSTVKRYPRIAGVPTHDGQSADLRRDRPVECSQYQLVNILSVEHSGESGLDSELYTGFS